MHKPSKHVTLMSCALLLLPNVQDCMSLLLVHQRPMPRQMRNLGSWNTVLLVQVRLHSPVVTLITNCDSLNG